MFQSTPANFTAGDRVIAEWMASLKLFQSTPANFTAGDLFQYSEGDCYTQQFQSTPANFTAGDPGGRDDDGTD